MKNTQNRIYAILGDVKRGAITIELGVYNIHDILDTAIAERDKEIVELMKKDKEMYGCYEGCNCRNRFINLITKEQ